MGLVKFVVDLSDIDVGVLVCAIIKHLKVIQFRHVGAVLLTLLRHANSDERSAYDKGDLDNAESSRQSSLFC